MWNDLKWITLGKDWRNWLAGSLSFFGWSVFVVSVLFSCGCGWHHEPIVFCAYQRTCLRRLLCTTKEFGAPLLVHQWTLPPTYGRGHALPISSCPYWRNYFIVLSKRVHYKFELSASELLHEVLYRASMLGCLHRSLVFKGNILVHQEGFWIYGIQWLTMHENRFNTQPTNRGATVNNCGCWECLVTPRYITCLLLGVKPKFCIFWTSVLLISGVR